MRLGAGSFVLSKIHNRRNTDIFQGCVTRHRADNISVNAQVIRDGFLCLKEKIFVGKRDNIAVIKFCFSISCND